MSSGIGNDGPWPLRAWGLTLLGGLTGLAIHLIVEPGDPSYDATPLLLALATFLGVGALAFGFVVERGRTLSSLAFAVVAGLVVAFTIYWNQPLGGHSYGEPWRILCGALTVGIAAPLFQALRDRETGARLSYSNVYNRAWVNAVLWCAVWVFVGIVWLMAWLLASLFDLIGIAVLKTLLNKDWAGLVLSGAALGTSTGLLRDRESVLGLLQRVVTTVLSTLAPVLAFGLLVFLAALPFTGLAPLWEATRSTTPILLFCVIGALVLANAVIGDLPEHEARHPVLRLSVPALGLAMLPLGIIAAVSTGSRIQQHGLTPDRLWAVVFVAIAIAYGLAYLWAVVRGRLAPAAVIRSANLKLAFALCALAFVLSTPLVNFGALSTRNQLARLESGAVSPEAFDWAALRFDFGPSGVAALKTLAKDGKTTAIRKAASDALEKQSRHEFPDRFAPPVTDDQLIILPVPTPLPAELRAILPRHGACNHEARCAVIHEAGSDEAILVTPGWITVWRREGDTWVNANEEATEDYAAKAQRLAAGLKAGQVEVRTVTRRQVYVAGEPHGQPFE